MTTVRAMGANPYVFPVPPTDSIPKYGTVYTSNWTDPDQSG